MSGERPAPRSGGLACFRHCGATPPDRRQPAMAPRRYARNDIRPRGAMAGASLALRPFG